MAKYYWNRYNAKVQYNLVETFVEKGGWTFIYGYHQLNFDGVQFHKPDGPETTLVSVEEEMGKSLYAYISNSLVYRFQVVGVSLMDKYSVTPSNPYYIQGSFITTVQAEENAYINNTRNSDGYWYVRGAKVNTAPTFTQIPTQSTKKDIPITINLANYFSDPQGDALTYTASSGNPSVSTATVSVSTLTLTGKEIGSVWITVNANDGEFTTSQGFALNVTNTAPTVSVTSPNANMTLYENDIFNIAGSAADVNANQSVTIYGQVNLEQRVVLGIGLSNAPIAFSKKLKFKGGRLFDGETAITGSLIDGVPHTLKIWAQDSDGGQSPITERAFYVVPNRPPILTVDAVQPSGIINTDKFSISGTASDPDKNTVTAAYRLNGGNSVELEIVEGKWAFDITLAQLQVGQNTIVVELMDSYDFKVSKTIKLNKNEVNTPILQSVARYKIEPPKGSAKGVLLFIERDEDMELEVSLSMTLAGEQEQYVVLTPENTAPMPNQNGVVEDTFYHEANEPKNNIILKLETSRETVDINHKIHLISGVVE
ncbi:hypothetical protein C3943_10985 [Lysinibacillus sp. B2A1]|nr:hypothetical protein C3943_10985 [Lysinibacillus sp. B2A1]